MSTTKSAKAFRNAKLCGNGRDSRISSSVCSTSNQIQIKQVLYCNRSFTGHSSATRCFQQPRSKSNDDGPYSSTGQQPQQHVKLNRWVFKIPLKPFQPLTNIYNAFFASSCSDNSRVLLYNTPKFDSNIIERNKQNSGIPFLYIWNECTAAAGGVCFLLLATDTAVWLSLAVSRPPFGGCCFVQKVCNPEKHCATNRIGCSNNFRIRSVAGYAQFLAQKTSSLPLRLGRISSQIG